MTDTDRVSTTRPRVTKLSRHHQFLEHQVNSLIFFFIYLNVSIQRSSSLPRNPRVKSIIHVSIKSPSRIHSSSDKLEKSSIVEDVNKQSMSATRSVSVTKVHRRLSQVNLNKNLYCIEIVLFLFLFCYITYEIKKN